jgi:putative FmdB family regulatory protein
MPIYEYQCEQCGLRFDRLESMAATPATSCPECHGPVHRVIAPVGVIFKGSGFYATDNRKSGSGTARNNRKADDNGGKSSDTGETSAAEAKTPPATETSD